MSAASARSLEPKPSPQRKPIFGFGESNASNSAPCTPGGSCTRRGGFATDRRRRAAAGSAEAKTGTHLSWPRRQAAARRQALAGRGSGVEATVVVQSRAGNVQTRRASRNSTRVTTRIDRDLSTYNRTGGKERQSGSHRAMYTTIGNANLKLKNDAAIAAYTKAAALDPNPAVPFSISARSCSTSASRRRRPFLLRQGDRRRSQKGGCLFHQRLLAVRRGAWTKATSTSCRPAPSTR